MVTLTQLDMSYDQGRMRGPVALSFDCALCVKTNGSTKRLIKISNTVGYFKVTLPGVMIKPNSMGSRAFKLGPDVITCINLSCANLGVQRPVCFCAVHVEVIACKK